MDTSERVTHRERNIERKGVNLGHSRFGSIKKRPAKGATRRWDRRTRLCGAGEELRDRGQATRVDGLRGKQKDERRKWEREKGVG